MTLTAGLPRLPVRLRAGSRRDDQRGASIIELVLYMPLLMTAILLAVQFSLIYLGNQAASAAAREANRVARVTGDQAQGRQTGVAYAARIGGGILENVDVQVNVAGGAVATTVVSGEAQQLLPFLPPPRVSERVEGPVERFVEDQ
ncbi:MAG TPA: TadE/TadG family type IV pilus assembly protein [Nocardioidaceae bacterium]|nr:TadE/TadG family type IV pilus assembly protein [Nocardioidaceae bacterium]